MHRIVRSLMLAAALTCAVAAQAWQPTKPIELVVHTAPGGGNDVLARAIAVMAEKEKLLPVRINVFNKPGGNGAVAAAFLAERKGEPHTIGLITSNWIIGPLVTSEAKVTLQDVTLIAQLVSEPALIAVRADSPYRTLRDFIEAAKAKPGALKQSGGTLTARDSIMRHVLQKETGARWAFISFPGGGERIAALLGGHVDMMIIEPEEAGENIRAGKIRVIAQIADKRLQAFPNVPTLKEAGYDVALVPQIRGVVAPPGIAPDVVAYWEDFCRRLVRTPSWRKYIEDNQFEDSFYVGRDFAKAVDPTTQQLRTILP